MNDATTTSWTCPITQETMVDPVMAADGHSYEKEAITQWLAASTKSPVTGLPLPHTTLVPNHALRNAIQEGLAARAAAAAAASRPPQLQPQSQPQPQATQPHPQPTNDLTTSLTEHPTNPDLIHARVRTTSTSTSTSPSATLPVTFIGVVDVSGSMGNSASEKPGDTAEGAQFSRLDLVKHSLNTAVNMMSERDSFSLITFSDRGKRVLVNVKADATGKQIVAEKVAQLEPLGGTNLYQGFAQGADVASELINATDRRDSLVCVVLLTDGEPTRDYDPPRGLLPSITSKISSLPPHVCFSTIAYGFGDALDSGLMRRIAEAGNGTYAYVPDGSMVGTVFIHLMANMMNVARCGVSLEFFSRRRETDAVFTLPVGWVQPDQPRDFVIPRAALSALGPQPSVRVLAMTNGRTATACTINDVPISRPLSGSSSRNGNDPTDNTYECARSLFVDAVERALALALDNDKERAMRVVQQAVKDLRTINDRDFAGGGDARVASLVSDLDHPDDMKGQISKAIGAWERWGKHYLPAVLFAHRRQERSNFKDASMATYGGARIDAAVHMGDDIFAAIPAPIPSCAVVMPGSASIPTLNIANLNNAYGGCFSGDTTVLLGNGTYGRVDELKKGDRVATCVLGEVATVVCVVETWGGDGGFALSRFAPDVALTPWHPVRLEAARSKGGGDTISEWVFPETVKPSKLDPTVTRVFNFVLDRTHVVRLGSGVEFASRVLACTLGHGLVENDVVRHAYFGTDACVRDLASLPGWTDGRVRMGAGTGVSFARGRRRRRESGRDGADEGEGEGEVSGLERREPH